MGVRISCSLLQMVAEDWNAIKEEFRASVLLNAIEQRHSTKEFIFSEI
jgi:hypothetical protein